MLLALLMVCAAASTLWIRSSGDTAPRDDTGVDLEAQRELLQEIGYLK
jgi:hypothetical protein